MAYRFYRSPAVTTTEPGNPNPITRNKLADHIPSAGDPSSSYEDVGNLCRPVFYGLAVADPATHAAIDADAEITALSPELADIAAVNAWLDQRAKPISQDILDLFITDGFPVTWLRDDHTRRQLFRHIMRIWRLRSYAVGDDSVFPHGVKLFERSLTDTFGALTQAQRNGARQWVERGSGVDTTSIITTSTTIEQCVNYLATNWIGLEPVTLGEVRF